MLHNHFQLQDSKIHLVEEILGAQSNNKNEPNNNNHNNNNYYNDMEYLYSQNIPLNPYLKPLNTQNKRLSTKTAGSSSKTFTKKHKSRKCALSHTDSGANKNIKHKSKTIDYSRKHSANHKCNLTSSSIQTRKKKRKKAIIHAIIDTGATRHCSNTTKHMNNIRKTHTGIIIANGSTIYATKMGDIGVIKDVLYLPELKQQLLFSVNYFLQSNPKHKFTFHFKDNIMQLKQKNKLVAQGESKQNRLYILNIHV